MATCIETFNMDPAVAGQKKVYFSQVQRGTLGESWLDAEVEKIIMQATTAGSAVYTISGPEKKKARVLVEVYGPKRELVIFGGGHIAERLAALGNLLDYRVTVVDNRPQYAVAERFHPRTRVFCRSYSKAAEHVTLGKQTWVVIATYGHQHDLDCLVAVLPFDLPYLGLVGSRRRQETVRQRLLELGFSAAKIDAIRTPVGLDIGAETPAEVALSIMAEMIALQRQRSGVPLKKITAAGKGKAGKATLLMEEPDLDLLHQIVYQREQGKAGAVATVVAAGLSTPRKSGAKMLIRADGTAIGAIGGGLVEESIREEAQLIINQGGLCRRQFSLQPGPGQQMMACGGEMEVFIEPLEPWGLLLTEEDLNYVR